MAKQVSSYADRAHAQNEVTAKIVAQLQNGVRPWSKSWTSGATGGMPTLPRRVSGEYYSGINIVLCWSAMQENGWNNQTFMTFQQANELGGCVRKGSKGTKVCYYGAFAKEVEVDGKTEEQMVPFLKWYSVFNCDQIDGLPARFYPVAVQPTEETVNANIANAREFFAGLGVSLRHGGDRAYYSPSDDFVQMPVAKAFRDAESYIATLAHEYTHATGHKSRCDRQFGRRFGDSAYAFEELVAELGAAFLCAELGITDEPREDHASYLASWISVLKTDSRAIFTAASLASKAIAWMRDQQTETVAIAA